MKLIMQHSFLLSENFQAIKSLAVQGPACFFSTKCQLIPFIKQASLFHSINLLILLPLQEPPSPADTCTRLDKEKGSSCHWAPPAP